MQALVSIISDWKNHDYYLCTVKSAIIAAVPDVRFIDVTHDIPAYNEQRAAFVLRSSYKAFPEGIVNLMCVNTEANSENPYVIIKNRGQYFIGTDTGIFGLVFDNQPEMVIYIYPDTLPKTYTFPCLSIYSKLACFILGGSDITTLGEKVDDIKRKTPLAPKITEGMIVGHILYIDSYNNGITNINRETFEKHVGSGKFDIFINSNKYHVDKICNSYNEVEKGDLVVIFNSLDLLEVAIREEDAASLLSLDKKTLISIRY